MRLTQIFTFNKIKLINKILNVRPIESIMNKENEKNNCW